MRVGMTKRLGRASMSGQKGPEVPDSHSHSAKIDLAGANKQQHSILTQASFESGLQQPNQPNKGNGFDMNSLAAHLESTHLSEILSVSSETFTPLDAWGRVNNGEYVYGRRSQTYWWN